MARASMLMLVVASSRAAQAAAPGAPSGGTLAPAAEQPIGERLAQVVRTQLKAEEKAVVRKMRAERSHAAPPSRKRKAERAVAKEIEMLATQRGTISVGEPGEPAASTAVPRPSPDPTQTMLRETRWPTGLNLGYALAPFSGGVSQQAAQGGGHARLPLKTSPMESVPAAAAATRYRR